MERIPQAGEVVEEVRIREDVEAEAKKRNTSERSGRFDRPRYECKHKLFNSLTIGERSVSLVRPIWRSGGRWPGVERATKYMEMLEALVEVYESADEIAPGCYVDEDEPGMIAIDVDAIAMIERQIRAEG